MRILCAIGALLWAACTPEEGPLMAPGQDCVECHGGGGEARAWTAAGTWSRGSHVTVTDANGKSITMRGNKVGNFYTAESLTPPLSVVVDGTEMKTTKLKSGGLVGYGGCNVCHVNGERKPDPELMAPGRDCLGCHRPDGTAWTSPFTVAGTWPGAIGIIVRDRGGAGAPFTIPVSAGAAVGNFHTDQPFVGQLEFTVQFPTETKLMDELVDYGGCNACHGAGGEADD